MAKFRPSQQFLDVFSTLSDGNDAERNEGAMDLIRFIKNSEESDKMQKLEYSKERLIRGLSSARKFARVGFSVALVQLLRHSTKQDVNEVLDIVNRKLKITSQEKKLKSEVGGIYLGRAFAVSALIQAGVVTQLTSDVLSSLVDELMHMSDRKSYIKPVCFKVLQDLLFQISADVFKSVVWPIIKISMKKGWQLCTLDKLSLLISCRHLFPEVVKKKFLKKYWGFPILSEENDMKLLSVVMASVQRSDVIVEQIIPHMLTTGRGAVAVWTLLGDKLLEKSPEEGSENHIQKQILGLKLASKLIASVTQSDLMLEIMLSPNLARCVFHSDLKKGGPVTVAAAHSLCDQMGRSLASVKVDAAIVLQAFWKLEESSGTFDLVRSNNFCQIMDVISRNDATSYSQLLIDVVLGHDTYHFISKDPNKKHKRIQWCLQQLLHVFMSQSSSPAQIIHSILALFLRLAFFNVNKRVPSIQHCDTDTNLEEGSEISKIAQVYFLKSLDIYFTTNIGQRNKPENLLQYLDVLSTLAKYVQDLLQAEDIIPITAMSSKVAEMWEQLMDFSKAICQNSHHKQELNNAFSLLSHFLGFYMLTHFQMAVDLLQDLYVCYSKATESASEDLMHSDDEATWIEVVMEILLKLMSIHSHLARIVATSVFGLLAAYLTPRAVTLITQILAPVKASGDVNEDILFEADDDDDKADTESEASENEEEESVEKHEVSFQLETSADSVAGNGGDDGNGDDDDGGDDEEESLPDLDDSEMFKFDEALAEVFKQRQKSSGKKIKEEKRQEMINFQIRVLDFIESLIKGERCGDFIYDIVKPLVVLTLRPTKPANQVLNERAKACLTILKSKAKTLQDQVCSVDKQEHLFIDLLALAKKETDSKHFHQISVACYIAGQSKKCNQHLMNAINDVISKKSTKPLVIFFKILIELDPIQFQELGPAIIHRLIHDPLKVESRVICCKILASLCKKADNIEEEDLLAMKGWMKQATVIVTEMMFSVDKVMFYKDVLTLAVALIARTDIFTDVLFDASVREHLLKVKSKFNTDIRRLANKIISYIDRQKSCSKSAQKRKMKVPAISSSPVKKKLSVL